MYGSQNPTQSEQMSNRDFGRTIRGVPAPSEAPGNRPDSPPSEGKGKQCADSLIQNMLQEGGAGLIKFLLKAAVSSTDARGKIPNVSKVREWQYRDLMRLPKAVQEEWKTACKEELEALHWCNVFKLTNLPKGRKIIGCRWVFDVKSDGQKKARLVAQGLSQVEGIDFNELFSPVVCFESVQLIFALSAIENYYCVSVDVRNAYPYGKLDEEIYMRQPQGFIARGQEKKVICLQCALYGLKQAGLAWWKELNSSMKSLGFQRLLSDADLFVCKDYKEIIIAIVYVDNAMFFGKDKVRIDQKKKLFIDKWECRDLGEVKEFLHMHITCNGQTIKLDQCAHLDKVLECFSMTNAKSAPTPLPSNWVPKLAEGKASSELLRTYQSIIGSLLYLMIGTRPDMAYAVTKLVQFAANPSQEHLNSAKYICCYLAGTKDSSIVYDGKTAKGIAAYTDSDWASDPITRWSVTGYFFKLAGGPITWQSQAQTTVAHSSTEAEYMVMSDCSHQVSWIRNIFCGLSMHLGPFPVYGDNQGSIFIGSNPVQEICTKHIDLKYHYVCECIAKGKIEVFFVPSEDNTANILTKNLGCIKFEKFRAELGLEFK